MVHLLTVVRHGMETVSTRQPHGPWHNVTVTRGTICTTTYQAGTWTFSRRLGKLDNDEQCMARLRSKGSSSSSRVVPTSESRPISSARYAAQGANRMATLMRLVTGFGGGLCALYFVDTPSDGKMESIIIMPMMSSPSSLPSSSITSKGDRPSTRPT